MYCARLFSVKPELVLHALQAAETQYNYLACKVFWQLIIHFPTVSGPFLPARDDCLLGRFLRSNCSSLSELDILPFSTVLGTHTDVT